MQRTETPEAVSDAEERAARQARLSKALSAAYLSHQITQLEDRVQGVGILGGGHHGGGRGGQRRTDGRRATGAAAGAGKASTSRTAGNRHRGDQQEHRTPLLATHTQGRGKVDDVLPGEAAGTQRLVLDTSSLLFALPTVKRLVHPPSSDPPQRTHYSTSNAPKRSPPGAELIVPLETLRTLDLLKKGMHPYAQAARAATRFVEIEQRRTRERARAEAAEVDDGKGNGKAKDSVPTHEHEVGEDGWRKIRPGLWVQQETERMDVFPSSDHQLPQPEDTVRDTYPQQEEETSLFPAPAEYVAETLACALYFREWWDVPSSQAVLAIAHPPATLAHEYANRGNVGGDHGTEGAKPKKDGEDVAAVERFAERAEGFAVREWAERGDVVFLDFSPHRPSFAGNTTTNNGTLADEISANDARQDGETMVPLLEEEVAVVRLTSEEDDPRAEVLGSSKGRKGGKQSRSEGQEPRNRRRPLATFKTHEGTPGSAPNAGIATHANAETNGAQQILAPTSAPVTPVLLTRVPQIFDAQKNGLVSSAEMKAQRDREAARYARQQGHGHGHGHSHGQGYAQGQVQGGAGAGATGNGGGRGGRNSSGIVKPRPLPTTATPSVGQGKARGMTLLQRPLPSSCITAPATGDTRPSQSGGAEPTATHFVGSGAGERRNGKGRRGGGGDRPHRTTTATTTTGTTQSEQQQPPVMLLQRPK
ncbi:hypothetical protein QFC21_001169 [Naganishia friedmannii]|uniref:Uncharacterized protein n=1 Tax=Naganishia friedmannii TaxID=89922 RepID=A0ACC2W7H7_9TREE|nr:hypothetical protein QFC21_001169 [Naganishia friedmannii]